MSNCFECRYLEPRSSSGLWKCLKAHNYFRAAEREHMENAPCVEFESKNEQTREVKMSTASNCFECKYHRVLDNMRVLCEGMDYTFEPDSPCLRSSPCGKFEPKNEQTREVKMPEKTNCRLCVDYVSGFDKRCAGGLEMDLPGACDCYKPKVEEPESKPARRFEVWDENKIYRGQITTLCGELPAKGLFSCWTEIPSPVCPDEPNEPIAPDYPDGWYCLEDRGGIYILKKRGATVVSRNGKQLEFPWSHFTVIASLEGVRFVQGGDHEKV